MGGTSEFDPYHKWLGIPPTERPVNHYRLLGLALFEDDADVITHAADRQMAHLKSFSAGPHASTSQQLLNELAEAEKLFDWGVDAVISDYPDRLLPL